MAKSFMNKNVNIILLLLVVLVVFIVLTSAVYFQEIFFKLTGRYNVQSLSLQNTSQLLEQYRELYDEISLRLNQTIVITESEKEDLRKVYTVTKTVLEEDISKLNSSLVETKNELLDTANRLYQKTSELNVANTEITFLVGEVDDLEREIRRKRAKIDELEAQISSLQDTCG